MPLQGISIPEFCKIFTFRGLMAPSLHRWSEIWHGQINLQSILHAKLHLYRCNVSPMRGKETKNRHMNNLNTSVCAVHILLLISN